MHEMSLAMSLFDIAKQEMDKHGKTKLVGISLCCGTLSNVVPEALQRGFEIILKHTAHCDAKLNITEIPLKLSCGKCAKEYCPEVSYAAVFAPCPFCGEEIGHTVISGKELYIEKLEVE